jgi:hypothetical protein
MSTENIMLPVLDQALLQEKTNEYALKGALKAIEEFYSGYNSPYKKAIETSLEQHEIGGSIDLPNIVAIINESLTAQIDTIANAAIAKTFVPLVNKFLSLEEKEIAFSKILQEFVESSDDENRYEYSVEVDKDERFGWLNIAITDGKRNYKFTLHEDYDSKKEKVRKYKLHNLPYDTLNKYGKTMKLSLDGGATLEMPFTPDILKDDFLSYLARIIIAGSMITMDCEDFDDDMFPERCHCD